MLLVELKKDEIIPENVDQTDDYVRLFTHHQMLNQAKGLRPMLIGQSVPAPIRIL